MKAWSWISKIWCCSKLCRFWGSCLLSFYFFLGRKCYSGAGEIAHKLKGLVTLPHIWWLTAIHNASSWEYSVPYSGLHGHQECTWYTYIHAGETFIHGKSKEISQSNWLSVWSFNSRILQATKQQLCHCLTVKSTSVLPKSKLIFQTAYASADRIHQRGQNVSIHSLSPSTKWVDTCVLKGVVSKMMGRKNIIQCATHKRWFQL